MTKSDMNRQLAEAKILPLLVKLTIPATVAQLVNAMYNIVDRMYIGHIPGVGTIALSGVGLTFPITMFISAFSFLPGRGGAPLASIEIGKGEIKKAQTYLCNAFSLLLMISAVMTVGGLAFLKPLLTLFGADAQTMPYAYDYLKIYLWGTLFVELTLGLNPFINAQGFTTVGTISVVIGAVLNIVLDPIFICTLNMGVQGAALASVISQMASSVWGICFLRSRKTNIRLTFADMKIKWETATSICSLGISPFTFRVNESLVMVVLNRLLLQWGGAGGQLHLAVMTILSSISQIFFMPLTGIVSGAQPILSYNFGAGNIPRVRETIRHARRLSLACAVVMWFCILVFSTTICRMFTDDETLILLAVKAMRIMFCTVFFLGYQMINQNAFVALGNTRYSFLFGIMRKVLLVIPLACLLPFEFGVWGVYAAEMIANPVTTVITFCVFERFMGTLGQENRIPVC